MELNSRTPIRFLFILAATLILFIHSVMAQDEKESNEPFKPFSSLGIMISHAHVFNGSDEGSDKSVLSLPAWGLNYDYNFAPHWAIGLHTDMILESFKVEKTGGGESETIERSFPIAPAVMGTYKATRHWNFLLGAGVEFASEGDYFLNRAGVEYKAEINHGWEVSGALEYDLKWNAYDSWTLGLGISKAF